MKKSFLLATFLFLFSTALSTSAFAHCEIPCGIYDDATRLSLIQEHIVTIEKSMNKIKELENGSNQNQLIRWVANKEDHANQLQEIVTQYFMTQRIKFDAKDYDKKLASLHQMLVYAMKCKQTVDLANVESLKKAAKEFHDLYSHKLKK